jgi:hypothetical protein
MRKPNTKAPKKKFVIRKVKMSELAEADRELLKKGMADAEAGRVTPLKVPKSRGLKVEATKQVMDVFHGIPEGDVQQILQHLVDHAAAQKRRKNTKSKLPKKPECKTCWGYGLHRDGTAPMGPMDAGDGLPTMACPECKRNPNPCRK